MGRKPNPDRGAVGPGSRGLTFGRRSTTVSKPKPRPVACPPTPLLAGSPFPPHLRYSGLSLWQR